VTEDKLVRRAGILGVRISVSVAAHYRRALRVYAVIARRLFFAFVLSRGGRALCVSGHQGDEWNCEGPVSARTSFLISASYPSPIALQ